MEGFIQVSASEFHEKCKSNRPFVRTIEAGKNVMNFYYNGNLVGKIVEERSKAPRTSRIGMVSGIQIKKSYFLRDGGC